jgi:hypothetical protein
MSLQTLAMETLDIKDLVPWSKVSLHQGSALMLNSVSCSPHTATIEQALSSGKKNVLFRGQLFNSIEAHIYGGLVCRRLQNVASEKACSHRREGFVKKTE